MSKIRYLMGLYSGKAVSFSLKVLKRKGSYMPGVISAKLDPAYLEHLPKPKRVLAVTGTNGKTTTSNIIMDILSRKNRSIVNNSAGSNTKYGILTALAGNLDFTGKKKSEVAVLEIDERWTPIIFKALTPEVLTITNIYQDSYKRNAHTDFIRDTINSGIPETTKLVLNADDLISAQIGPNRNRVFYSIAPLKGEEERRDSRLKDIRYCPTCGTELVWDFVRYHHLGRAHCPDCGFTNPEAKYTVTAVDHNRKLIYLDEDGTGLTLPLILGTTEALYNQLAAYCALREFGLTSEEISADMEQIKVVATRFNKTVVGNRAVYLISAKGLNPIANSRVFDIIQKHPGNKTVIYSNDDEPAGRYKENLSWIYDTDFQYLAIPELDHFIINSWRAGDIVVRALTAGIPEEKIQALNDYRQIPELIRLNEAGDIFILNDIGDESLKMANYMKDEIVKRLQEGTK